MDARTAVATGGVGRREAGGCAITAHRARMRSDVDERPCGGDDLLGGADRGQSGGRRFLPHFGQAARWLIVTVATAAIGVVVAAVVGGWLSDDDEQRSPPPPPFPQTRLISAQRIGLYRIEAGADAEDAMRALGQPSARETPHATTCEATWERLGVRMRFANFGARDPCLYGTFCNARINGDEWGTTRGLQVGEPVSRMRELYPRAEQVREPGAIVRFVLEPGAQPCGPDAKGGLEAWTASGRIISLVVSLAAGGD